MQNEAIELSKREINIILCWVPAHKGITGNETSDKVAKEATKMIFVDSSAIANVTEIKQFLIDKVRQKWNLCWLLLQKSNAHQKVDEDKLT